MIIPVAGLVPMFGAQALTVERATAAAPNLYGEQVVTRSNVSIVMSVHQVSRRTLERAGMDYGHDWRAFYANEELRTAPDTADIVQYAGERWELHEAGDYGALGGIFTALGKRIE